MGSSPPAKRSIHSASGMVDPNRLLFFSNNGTPSKRSKPPPAPLAVPSGHVSFRLLSHESFVGGVIGKSGSVIKQLQLDSSAKIRVEVPPTPSDDQRVVLVVGSAFVNKRISLGGVGGEEFEVSSAQEALVRVFERIVDVASDGGGVPSGDGNVWTARLLAGVSLAGSVIGKGGKVVEKIRKDTGCKIRVLGSEKLPACASPDDEMVEIEGKVLAVKKALVAVSRCIQECLSTDKSRMSGIQKLKFVPEDHISDLCNVRKDVQPQPSLTLQPAPSSSVIYTSSNTLLSMEADRAPSLGPRMQQYEVVFKILCSNDRVGGVIGKGGTIIQALQNETGASIAVGSSVAQCDERLITIIGKENSDSHFSPAQRATILVFNRSVEAGFEKGLDLGTKKLDISARLVVPVNQVGCLLGKGGAIISEIRKLTGAAIRIFRGVDQVPKCISESDEVVQITGEFVNVQDALYNITLKLRDNIIPSKTSLRAGTKYSSSVVSDLSLSMQVRNSYIGLDSSASVSHGPNQSTALNRGTNHLDLSSTMDLAASPRTVAIGSPRGVPDVGWGLTSLRGSLELGSGSRSAIVTNTTVEMSVPEDVMGLVYGENGSNLDRLRQISGAKVTVRDQLYGADGRIVVISGTPDETQAAQSLLHAFILTGSS